MIKRTIEISQNPAHISVRNKQLKLQREGKNIGSIPCEDIGTLLVDNPQTTYTHSALVQLAESGATVVLCGANHLPTAIILPLSHHSEVVWRMNAQLSASKPLCKKLWQQIIQAKISRQALNLDKSLPARKKLIALVNEVRSGDPANIEAQAARVYWNNWLWQEEFRRDREAPGLNSFLNYGYAILRAAIARAIVSAGMIPTLGLHHRNRSNMFCLADDLIEPLRPFVDDRARELYRQGYETLDQSGKAAMLKLLSVQFQIGCLTGPLMVMIHRMVSSLVRCFEGKQKHLEIPLLC